MNLKKYLLLSFLIVFDIIFLVIIFYFALFLRSNISGLDIPEFNEIVLNNFSFVFFILIALMLYEKIYNYNYDFWQETLNILKSSFIGFIMVLSILALTKTNFEYSRIFIVIYFISVMMFLPIMKRILKKFIYSFAYFKKKVLVVGNEEQVKTFKKEFEENWYLGQVYVTTNYDSVIIVPDGLNIDKLNEIIIKYLNKSKELYVVPYLSDINFAHSNIMEYSNIRYNTIQIENKLFMKSNILIKEITDKLLVLSIFPFFVVIHVFISLIIKLDSSGSVLFRQHRLGKNNVDFICYKYRSMYINSEDILCKYLKENPDEIEYYEEYHKYRNDPRITKIGKILRSTSLDELPQILNIIKGNMSLVGPRPYMITESDKLGKNQHFILKVKPGITGLWQVSGRNELTFKQRNELEIWYIKNWSLWADMVILIKTLKVVLLKIGAR